MWLVNLAVADLVFCFMRVPWLVKKLFFNTWPYGVFVCRFTGFFKYTNMFCSVFLLAVISMDRALCIWRPHFAKRRRTLPAARVAAFAVWVAAVGLSVPYFVYRNVSVGKTNLSRCSLDDRDMHSSIKTALYANRFLCGFLLPFVVILISYVLAAVGIRRTRLLSKSRQLRILPLLVMVFFLCWAPYHCIQLAKMADEKKAAVKTLSSLSATAVYFSSCINPILYFCTGMKARGHCQQSLTGVCRTALEDDLDRSITQSNKRSLDDCTAVAAGRTAAATLAERPKTPAGVWTFGQAQRQINAPSVSECRDALC